MKKMFIEYSIKNKIHLSLKYKVISRKLYEKKTKAIIRYGKKKQNPRASVIIVTYNEGDDLIRNLNHWKKQTIKNFEIILVDNGLDDKTVSKIKEFDILHIQTFKNIGCCAGRNLGVLHANADIIIFSDADGYNLDDYMMRCLDVMDKNNFVAVRGMVIPIHKITLNDFFPHHYNLGNNQIPSVINAEGNSVWRKTYFLKAGGFEESMASGEGLVLQYRMTEFYKHKKQDFVYDPSLILFHDYHQGQEILSHKIRQNMIIRKLLLLRYPLIDDFLLYYDNIKPKKNHKNSIEVDCLIDKIRRDIEKENLIIQRNCECVMKNKMLKYINIIKKKYNFLNRKL